MPHANFGSGPDIKKDDHIKWYNIDNYVPTQAIGDDSFIFWDMTQWLDSDKTDFELTEKFDGGVINHVLCTMNDYQAHLTLINIHRTLKPGAKLIVIDMSLLKVFNSYAEGRLEDIPISEGTLDDRLCLAISGYGTRKSLYTPARMMTVLKEAGFRTVRMLDGHQYDTRPKESLIFEATK